MSRNEDLMRLAALEFDRGTSPFRTDWLIENSVTADECMTLSENIGLALRVFANDMRLLGKDDFVSMGAVARLVAAIDDREGISSGTNNSN